MPSKDNLAQLLSIHKRRLQILKEQPQANPAVIMEIADIKAEIRQREVELEGEHGKNKDQIEKVLQALNRRLKILQERQLSIEQKVPQELRDIEAEIQRLEAELEDLDR